MSEILNPLRTAIEEVDAQVMALLVRRMRLSVRIAALKSSTGLPVLDAGREAAVLASVAALDSGPMTPGEVRAIYELLLATSRAVQERAAQAPSQEPS